MPYLRIYKLFFLLTSVRCKYKIILIYLPKMDIRYITEDAECDMLVATTGDQVIDQVGKISTNLYCNLIKILFRRK